MAGLTEEGRASVAAIAQAHGFSTDAAIALLGALAQGQGSQAQFNHPEFGGMGQWSRGGMIMIGDMFNNGLKARVDGLANALSDLLARSAVFVPPPVPAPGVSLFVAGGSGGRWPAELGNPASSGSQNDLHYAIFPGTRRLAIERGGRVTVYDTGAHQIFGIGQAQSGDQTLSFTSQLGLVRLSDLPIVTGASDAVATPVAAPAPVAAAEPAAAAERVPTAGPVAATPMAGGEADIFAKIEKLADLHAKQILTTEEFQAKKAELLGRL
ncbi:MAG: SHOCT domain-containing protein [Amaricoccus sp.]